MRYVCKRKTFYFITVGIAVIVLLRVRNGFGTYDYIEKKFVFDNLHTETAENFTSNAYSDCGYKDILTDEATVPISLMNEDLIEGHRIRDGGEYIPLECRPKFSVAVIVPYRDRAEQLRGFLVYMHMFLRHQRIHYRIYIVEQVDSRPFNRAKLMNIGAVAAMQAGYPCLILHDIDLLPLKTANIYACTEKPRHMSSSINKFRFVLPYLELFGGAIAVTSQQFKTINGMSNEYYGWSGEDDDLYARLEASKIKICRFEPSTSQYHLISHKSPIKHQRPRQILESVKARMKVDGLNSLKYSEIATVLHPLFTHIMVDL